MEIKLCLNVISLLTVKSLNIPVSIRPFQSLNYLLHIAQATGFDGAQILPIRTAKPDQDFLGLRVWAEEGWNPVWLWIQTLPGLRNLSLLHGAEDMPAHPQDYAIFPSPRACSKVTEAWRKRDVPFISHHFGSDRLVEFGTQLGLDYKAVGAKCHDSGCKLVIDTKHLKEYLDQSLTPLLPETVIEELAPYIEGLHVQPPDLGSFLQAVASREDDFTIRIARQVAKMSKLEFVTVEYHPVIEEVLSPAISFTQAVRMREALEVLFE